MSNLLFAGGQQQPRCAGGANNSNADGGEAGAAGGKRGGGLVRHLLVTINGNRAMWDHMSIHGALWRVSPERASTIFCSDPADACDPAGAADLLSRALIKKVTVLELNTNIDEVVAVTIDGLPPKEFTGSGDGAALYVTGEGRVTAPQEVFNLTGNTELGMAWMQQFPRYTAHNIDSEGVMLLSGTSYYFVHEEHPVIHMLKTSEGALGVQLTQDTMVEGHWYKVDLEAFVFCIKTIRETILHNAPATFNLNTLTVRIARPDGQKWLTFSPQVIDTLVPEEVRRTQDAGAIQEAKMQGAQRYIDRPLFLTMRLAFEYALPEGMAAAARGGGGGRAAAAA